MLSPPPARRIHLLDRPFHSPRRTEGETIAIFGIKEDLRDSAGTTTGLTCTRTIQFLQPISMNQPITQIVTGGVTLC